MSNIYLIGFMGVGKSTIGKKLARKLGYDFIDMDDAFEEKYKIDIHRFFEKYGEELFRKLEYQLLISTFKMKNVVISTGGGTVCYSNAMEQMNRNGTTVYFTMSAEGLEERLKTAKRKRPLIAGKNEKELRETITQRLIQRLPYYKKANLTIDVEHTEHEKILKSIQKVCHTKA